MSWGGMKIPEQDLVAPKKRGAQKKDKEFTTVWDQYAAKTREGIDTALAEVIGRYGDGEMIPMPRKTYNASKNWSVPNATKWDSKEVGMGDMPESVSSDDGAKVNKDKAYFEKNKAKIAEHLAAEEVVLNVKCGGQYRMPFFWDEKKGKLVQTQKVVSSAAVAKLKEIKVLWMECGRMMEVSVLTSTKPQSILRKSCGKGKAKYIEKWDCMVEPKEMEQAEKFFGS